MDFTIVLKLLSGTIFKSLSSAFRLPHAVDAKPKGFLCQFSLFSGNKKIAKCQENEDCDFHVASLKEKIRKQKVCQEWLCK